MRIIGIAKARLLGDVLSKSLPYLLIELLLPGGTMFALLLLLWQRRRATGSNRQAAQGGFLMTDDFHGTAEWEVFISGMSRIFPDRPIVEIESRDAIFHVLYDLDDKIQVAGTAAINRGLTYERFDSQTPHWRGIYDDKNRLMVAITFNQDYGDAWEWADAPWYPEKMTSQAYRLGINYIIYSMTH